MDLDDPKWSHLHGGYRVPYDPRKAFLALEQAQETVSAWEELWTELYHQGDVGEASYAAVEAAWRELVKLGLRELEAADEPALVSSIIGVIAIGKGQFTLGRLAVIFTEDERQQMLKTTGWA